MTGGHLRALARLAWRESRTTRRRLLLHMSAIALGVAALVAIDSFASNVARSVHDSSRTLLGGDLALTARAPLAGRASALLDSLGRAGARSARVTTFPSMATIGRTGRTRLAQIRAVSADYPLVGTVGTDPAGAWTRLASGASAIVDRSLLATLDARIGDTLTLGYARYQIVGTILAVPGDAGIAAAIGPRVFISESTLAATRLLTFGSRAEYRTLLTLRPATVGDDRWAGRVRRRLSPDHVRLQTAADAETSLTDAVHRMSEFLGIVGVVALLLGGVGVASGISAFVDRKIDTAATLRCLGATGRQVLLIYVAQAAVMGLAGAALGALIGVGVQYLLPVALRDFIPVDVAVTIVPRPIATGLAVGLWVALLFALRPLLSLRRVSPLQALRREVERHGRPPGSHAGSRRPDPAVAAVTAAIAASVVVITVVRAPTVRVGIGTSVGIGAAFLALWLLAGLLSAVARRAARPSWPYVARQGVANLHRPGNQTRAVIVALGFGAFLLSTLYLVQSALIGEFTRATRGSAASLLFFDVQDDQVAGLDSLIRGAGDPVLERTPIVTMRIAAINDVPVSAEPARGDAADSDQTADRPPATRGRSRGPRRAAWALRREYRSTYRDTLVATERVVAGRWSPRAGGDSSPSVSFEDGVAKELGVGVGDHVTWNVQGVPVRTTVTSLRDVDWARFEPNFFAVFPTGVLDQAPKQFVVTTRVPGADATGRLQRAVVDRYPNVSSIDLTLVRETVDGILRKITVAIRFLAIFCLAMGAPVLLSAVAAGRRDRVREGVLLKTLGATRRQVVRIMVAEYAVLGVMGSVAGVVLSFGGAWALTHYVFETPLGFSPGPAVVIAALTAALTVSVGLAGGRDVFADTPLAMLRTE